MSHRSPRRRWGGSGAPSAAPALGGPSPILVGPVLPGGRPTRRRLLAPTPWDRRRLGAGGQHLQSAGIRPRLASPVPPSLSQCRQHPQFLSVSRSLSVLLPPVLVRWDEPGDREGCYGVKGHGLACVESWPAVGARGAWGPYVTRAVCTTHVLCVYTYDLYAVSHTCSVSRVCVSHVLYVSYTWFPCHMCSLVYVCPACVTCVFLRVQHAFLQCTGASKALYMCVCTCVHARRTCAPHISVRNLFAVPALCSRAAGAVSGAACRCRGRRLRLL